jgi:peptidoglycan/xylan/chitin deacetylase (PgdA/CDA1 family)
VSGTSPVRTTVGALARRDRGRRDQLAVLTYHRVDTPSPDTYAGMISASPEAFAAQVEWLAADYHPISMAELLARRDGGPALPRKAILLTFDDAYDCFARHAWPTLRAAGVPATLFVPTAYPGAPQREFWWDRLARAVSACPAEGLLATALGEVDLRDAPSREASSRRLREAAKALPHDDAMAAIDATVEVLGGASGPVGSRVLDWAALRRLHAEGVSLGVHTRTHPLLDRLPAERLDDEIDGAYSDLVREIGPTDPTIAYPNGNHSPVVLAAVERSGLRLGFTTRRGTNDLDSPAWLTLQRINVGSATTQAMLQVQVQGWFGAWR